MDGQAVGVEGDHAVLLAGDRDGGGLAAPVADHGVAGVQPAARVDSGPWRMRRGALREHCAVVGVDEHGLGGLRRGVDADDASGAGHISGLVRVMN